MESGNNDNNGSDSVPLAPRRFGDIFILYPDGRKYGPGTLSFTETVAVWTDVMEVGTQEPRAGTGTGTGIEAGVEGDGVRSHRWEARMEEVNLQAIGSDGLSEEDGTAGYVIVQVGDDYDEVRLIHKTNNAIVQGVFQAFCQGVAQCPDPSADDGDDEDNDNAFVGSGMNSNLEHDVGDDQTWFPSEDFEGAQQTHDRLLAMMSNSLSAAGQEDGEETHRESEEGGEGGAGNGGTGGNDNNGISNDNSGGENDDEEKKDKVLNGHR